MPEVVTYTQAREVLRVAITATAENVFEQAIAALNARQTGLGDACRSLAMGGSIVSSASFTVGDSAALVATKSIAANVEYSEPCTTFLADTWATGASPLVVTIWLSGNPLAKG